MLLINSPKTDPRMRHKSRKLGAYGVGNNIPVGWSNFSAVLVTRYLCASCGFSEEWVDDKAGLGKLAAKYNR